MELLMVVLVSCTYKPIMLIPCLPRLQSHQCHLSIKHGTRQGTDDVRLLRYVPHACLHLVVDARARATNTRTITLIRHTRLGL